MTPSAQRHLRMCVDLEGFEGGCLMQVIDMEEEPPVVRTWDLKARARGLI